MPGSVRRLLAAGLLDGTPAADEVRIVRLPLATYYRATGRPITGTLDVTDGLDRWAEAPELVAAGRSIAESAERRRSRSRWTTTVG
jgi:hypothetical protein